MAPSTPQKKTKRHEYDTTKRCRFFNAFDSKREDQGVATVAHLPGINIPPSTARRWLKERERLGAEALRTTRKTSSILGRKAKVSALDLARLTDQSNPEHELHYAEQAKLLPNKPSQSTLRRHTHRIGARRFQKPFVTEVSTKNRPIRVAYGKKHEKESLTGFWQWIWFTDEAHFQCIKLQNKAEFELRIPGQERQHTVSKSSGLAVTVHVAAGISYNHKGPLISYKDPKEPSQKERKAPKPRRSKYEDDTAYQARLKVYEDSQPKEDTRPKGNCMTQVFYAKEVLPQHIQQIQALEQRHGRRYQLQEDGDPSHGKRSKEKPPALLKRDADLLILIHPPQSPDLNPIEACWMIMKKRLRGKTWTTVRQFKADIQAEWDQISLAQIRRRIREMPQRMQNVQLSQGERIQSTVW